MRPHLRIASLLVVSLLVLGPGLARADEEVELQGIVDVQPQGPGGMLTLPLPAGSPNVTVLLEVGIPAVAIPFTITPETEIDVEEGSSPVTLVDGDRVTLDALIVGGTLFATDLEVNAFPELELRGTAGGLPASGVALPLPQDSPPVDFTLDLGVAGVGPLPVRVTSDTQVEDSAFTLMNGEPIEIEGLVRDFVIVITEIEPILD